MRDLPAGGTRPPSLSRAARSAPGLLLGLLLVALGACRGSHEDPVVFGLAGPFGTTYGASMRDGAELARREINQAGGIDGRTLELRALDDAANPDSALLVADSLFRDPAVVAVVGHVNSSTMAAAAATYQKGLPAVATSATSPQISRLGEWIFRVASSDSANSVKLAQAARRLSLPTAILYQNEDYGRGLASGFRASLESTGGRVLEADPYLSGTRDLTPYLERMRRRGVQLVFIAGLQDDAARIERQAHAVGLQARFLGGDGLEGLRSEGAEFDGTLVGLLYHPQTSAHAEEFAERFRGVFHREPDAFAALGYDATRLLARAASEAGPERARIRAYLERVGRDAQHPALEGVTGTIRFDENGDPVGKGYAVGVIRGGRVYLNAEL